MTPYEMTPAQRTAYRGRLGESMKKMVYDQPSADPGHGPVPAGIGGTASGLLLACQDEAFGQPAFSPGRAHHGT